MSPEARLHIDEILDSALALAETDRQSYLAEVCRGNPELRREVESLLVHESRANQFLEKPAFLPEQLLESVAGPDTVLEDGSRQSIIGQIIGHYKILREIGSGGMGRVYFATRSDDFQKSVAVKLLRAGVDSDELIARFRVERQILAAFDHPNIARLIDGGATADGRPYLVMEYVQGVPIDQYCDAKRLSIEERLRLFLPVCSAVQYAHRNLVVHRDLKPSNIPVTEDGAPKLLDFGIAKLLRPELAPVTEAFTATGMRMMTPGYASPEQVLGGPITTATDVYSLSAVLYQLLTGHQPFRLKTNTVGELYEMAKSGEPTRPSAVVQSIEDSITPEGVSEARNCPPERLRRLLTGDLDSILLRGLQKDPQRRYSSVEQFADDIRNYLEGRPVIACKETFVYRARKFVRRNKGRVLAAALVFLTLAGGVVATAWQARVAERSRSKAERRFQDVRKLAHSVVFELHDAIQNLPGSTKARELLVNRALEYLDSLAREANGDASLQLELADAYEKIGRVQWEFDNPSLGDPAASLSSQQKALAIRKAVLDVDPTNKTVMASLATSFWLVAASKLYSSSERNVPEALTTCNQALKLRQELAAATPTDMQARVDLAQIYTSIGDILYQSITSGPNMGDKKGAAESYRKAQEIYEELAAAHPQDSRMHMALAAVDQKLAGIKMAEKDYESASALYRKSLALTQEVVRQQPDNAIARHNLARIHERIGTVLINSKNPAAALESYGQALRIRESLAGADPENYQAHEELTMSLRLMSNLAVKSGRASDTERYTRRLLERSEERRVG